MYSIVVYLSENTEAFQYLINGLIILQNRGYDSSGICTINNNNEFINTKYSSKNNTSTIDMLKKDNNKHKNNNKYAIREKFYIYITNSCFILSINMIFSKYR